jgi:hypothetical protein
MNIQVVRGNIIGREHRLDGKNCQDADAIIQTQDRFVSVVADGCGGTAQSEYGAIFGANVIAKTIYDLSLKVHPDRETDVFKGRNFWSRVEQDALAQMRTNVLLLGGEFQGTVMRYFLFTSLGILITPNTSTFFSIGDGNFYINGERIQLGPYPDNAPPYLAYRLLTEGANFLPDFQFKIDRVMKTSELNTFLIGSDGVNYIADNENSTLPGRSDMVGPMQQFWQDQILGNPVGVELRLRLMGEDRLRIDWENQKLMKFPGILGDDVTIVAGRMLH